MTLAQKLARLRVQKVPPGWFTREQLAKREGYATADSFGGVLASALKAGLLEKRAFTVVWGNMVRARNHYRYR